MFEKLPKLSNIFKKFEHFSEVLRKFLKTNKASIDFPKFFQELPNNSKSLKNVQILESFSTGKKKNTNFRPRQ